jgi:cytochrome c oxidase subunit 3
MDHDESRAIHLEHHFQDAAQQYDAAKLGMWIFILTEVLLFGGLFAAYTVYRAWYPEMFFNAHHFLSRTLGTANTIVLITSSLTMALAIRSMELGRRKPTLVFLLCTLLLAAAFLFFKYLEYSEHFRLGQLPGRFYTFTGIKGTNPHIFFTFYYTMTGLHGLHIVGGMTVITIMLIRTLRNDFSAQYYTPLELTGLYWHLVDIIWIFLFPLLYLIG